MQYRMPFDILDNASLKPKIRLGWAVRRLAELCEPDRIIVTPGSRSTTGLPVLMLEHIESNTGKITLPSVVNDQELQSTAFLFNEEHVLYAKLRPYLNKVALPNFQGICTTELVPLHPFPKVSRRYLAWLLRRPETVAFAMQGITGGRMPRANLDELLTLEVPIPESLEEQERISDIIEHRFRVIELAKAACIRQLELLETLSKRILTDISNI